MRLAARRADAICAPILMNVVRVPAPGVIPYRGQPFSGEEMRPRDVSLRFSGAWLGVTSGRYLS